MRYLQKLSGLSGARARRLTIVGGIALAIIIFLVLRPHPVRYELEPAGNEIDFAAPELPVHTAADGVAVVRPQRNAHTQESDGQTVDAAPPIPWEGDSTATHGGFTLPISITADSDSIGTLSIPVLNLSIPVYESENEMEDMDRGVAHFKHTSAWEGNVALSAHNINFNGSAGFFRDLHLLKEGAVLRYETVHGVREYAVEAIAEISETDWSKLTRTEDNRLTLITCISGQPEKRLCVQAVELQP